MLDELVKLCDERYQSRKCNHCSYKVNCPHDCGKCLEYVHFPNKAPTERQYDCEHMVDFYVCKYAHKYTSELVSAFMQLRDLKQRDHLNVLSIGCGPCTDLMAIDYLKNEGAYRFESLDYRGVEIKPDIWGNVYDDIFHILDPKWSIAIISEDICQYINELILQDWKPDLIVMQYVFSDMQKHTQLKMINNMIDRLAFYIDSCSKNTYIVCNDINLSVSYGGGREYFDFLYQKITSKKTNRQFHFKNNKSERHFDYGTEYESNALRFLPSNELDRYQPYLSCSSAQMIIKNEE